MPRSFPTLDGLPPRIRTGLALVPLWVAFSLGGASHAFANEARPASDDPALEAQMMAIAAELRCLVCQNQTVADSHSGLAEDLRREIREQLSKGLTDEQVREHMTARYGDFVLYRPPVKATTWLLWGGPALLAIIGLLSLGMVLRRRAAMPADAFEPDTNEKTSHD